MKKFISALLVMCMFATILIVQTSAETLPNDITNNVKFIYDIEAEEFGLDIIKDNALFVEAGSFATNNTGKDPGAATRNTSYTLIDGSVVDKSFPMIWLNNPTAETGLQPDDAKLEYNFNIETAGTYEFIFVVTADGKSATDPLKERGFAYSIDDSSKSNIKIDSVISMEYKYTYSYADMVFTMANKADTTDTGGGDYYFQPGLVYGITADLTAGTHKLNFYHYEGLGSASRPNFNGFYVQPATEVQGGSCGDIVTWRIHDKTLVIDGKGAMETYSSESATPWALYSTTIEQVLVRKDVTSISEYTFKNYANLKKVTFGNALAAFPATGFSGCDNLETVLLTGEITGINEDTFKNTNLKTLIMQRTGENAFNPTAIKYCSSLESLHVAGQLASVTADMFTNCVELKSIKLSVADLATGLPSNLFKGATKLESVNITGNIGAIGDSAFEGCTALSDFNVTGDVTSIGNSAFKGCAALTEFEFLVYNKVTSIGDNAFEGCAALTKAKPAKSVTSIGANAYKDCTALATVEIKAEVTTIGDGAFNGCTAIDSFKYLGTIAEWEALVGDKTVVADDITIVCSDGSITPTGVVVDTTVGKDDTTTPNNNTTAPTSGETEKPTDDETGCACGGSSIFVAIAAFVSGLGVFVFTKKRI